VGLCEFMKDKIKIRLTPLEVGAFHPFRQTLRAAKVQGAGK
jgi:hypothetical protein